MMNFLVCVSYLQYDCCKVCMVIDTDDQELVQVEIMRVSVVQMSNEN